VLLIRPKEPPTPHLSARGWADSLHDVEARQAYEMRALEALGPDGPEVRHCAPSADEAAEIILEMLFRPPADDAGADSDYESDDVFAAERPLAKADPPLEKLDLERPAQWASSSAASSAA
jgi:hypothetical protein